MSGRLHAVDDDGPDPSERPTTCVGTTRHAPSPPSDLERAQALYRQRRARDAAFPTSPIFREPAWDILLDMFIAQERGKVTTATGACEGGYVAPTTGLRWLERLEKHGLITSARDERDNRRRVLVMTPEADEMMRRYLRSL